MKNDQTIGRGKHNSKGKLLIIGKSHTLPYFMRSIQEVKVNSEIGNWMAFLRERENENIEAQENDTWYKVF